MSGVRHGGASLRIRLLVAAAITTVVALGLSGFGLTILFERHLARNLDHELTLQLSQLAAHINVDAEGDLTFNQRYEDPRFTQPLSGYYWQITELLPDSSTAEGDSPMPQQLSSRSLWDQELTLPAKALKQSGLARTEIPGPENTTLIALTRHITVSDTPAAPVSFQLIVARDRAYLTEARQSFGHDLLPALAQLCAVLIAAAALQVYVGLRPLEAIRREIQSIRQGQRKRLSDHFPREVQPLADELNVLLETQSAALTRARERAADLAHGLMTPLTAMTAIARRLRERQQDDLAGDIGQLTEQMRLHVGHEMARARIQAGDGSGIPVESTPLHTIAQRLFRTLQHTPSGERLDWELDAPEDLSVPIEQHDLTELLGNLLDNAVRHATQTVRLSARRQPQGFEIVIEDDGSGIPPERRPHMLQRGARLDRGTAGMGAGLGLSIVSRIVDAYSGRIDLDESPLGGLRIAIHLPSSTAAAG